MQNLAHEFSVSYFAILMLGDMGLSAFVGHEVGVNMHILLCTLLYVLPGTCLPLGFHL